MPIEGEEALADWLSERKGERVYLRLPARGPKAERVALAPCATPSSRTAAASAATRSARRGGRRAAAPPRPRRAAARASRASTSRTSRAPRSSPRWWSGKRAGCARASTAASTSAASPARTTSPRCARRSSARYRRRLEEAGAMPDLILIDGGRGQLNAALAALAVLGVEETPIVGLAKREEELYLPGLPEPLRLPRARRRPAAAAEGARRGAPLRGPRHRRRRSARTLRSALDDLPGVGPTPAQAPARPLRQRGAGAHCEPRRAAGRFGRPCRSRRVCAIAGECGNRAGRRPELTRVQRAKPAGIGPPGPSEPWRPQRNVLGEERDHAVCRDAAGLGGMDARARVRDLRPRPRGWRSGNW